MATVLQYDTGLADCCLTSLAEELQLFLLMSLSGTKRGALQYVFIVLVLELFDRQDTVIFVAFEDVVCTDAAFTVKYATLEAIRTLRTFVVAISTCHLGVITFFDSQHIN